MSDEAEPERASRREAVALVRDPAAVAQREAENGVRQFDAVLVEINEALHKGHSPLRVRPSLVMELNRLAIDGINNYAGVFRPHAMGITNSKHTPPPAREVPRLVEELCDYIERNWEKPAIHLAAYVLWRVNWIHPFDDGNGRTARALCHFVMCVRMGAPLPITDTIPDQISRNKGPYYRALEAADAAFGQGRIDVSDLEALLQRLLARQLAELYERATGSKFEPG